MLFSPHFWLHWLHLLVVVSTLGLLSLCVDMNLRVTTSCNQCHGAYTSAARSVISST